MSSDIAVEIHDLRKTYKLATSSATSIAEVVLNRFKRDRRPVQKLNALNGVNVTIGVGEAVGIVGHNGAGKSTLLKILSRVTEPTAGSVRIRGRVGALLEVGTGFHPELTGRENVFLNGSLLGMRHNEVRDRFDEIVEFSGVERFLDIPVKRYSSGMSVRLAFAVASSLRSDVLIVDEVLAVGDAEFQKKCLGRMAEVSSEGRTVLFVSHNLVAVQALCTKAILLKSGQVQQEGTPAEIVHAYLQGLVTSGAAGAPGVTELGMRPDGERRPYLRRVQLRRDDNSPTSTLNTGGPAVFDVVVDNMDSLTLPHIGLSFWTETETLVATMTTQMQPAIPQGTLGSQRVYRLQIPRLPLLPGSYWVDVGVRVAGASEYLDLATRAFSVTVVGTDVYGSGVLPTEGEGVIYVEHSWHVR